MEKLIIDQTKYTPLISLDPEKGIFDMVGKSYPENTFEFYKPMMDWIKKYFDGNEQKKTIINIEIIYFNSSSSKLFFDFFDLLEEANENGKDIEINWIYDVENESGLEAGEDFQEDFETLKINLVEKEEE